MHFDENLRITKGDNKMLTTVESSKKHLEELDDVIAQAMAKVSVQKETHLCVYLPTNDGRLHHFLYRRMKKTKPVELLSLIRKHILENENPAFIKRQQKDRLPQQKPNPRLKKSHQPKLKKSQIDRLINILEKTGDSDLIQLFSPHRSLTQVKRLMIEMIRKAELDQSLIDIYARLVQEQKEAKALS